MLLQDRPALEGGGDDQKVEVPTAARGAGVAIVPSALVAQLQVGGLEALLQGVLDPLCCRHGPRRRVSILAQAADDHGVQPSQRRGDVREGEGAELLTPPCWES